MRVQRSEKFKASFQLLYLSILTVFGILLIVVGSIAKSPVWEILIYISILTGAWAMYIFQVGSDHIRIYSYTVLAALGLIDYGAHATSLTDMPLVVCLLIIILSVIEDIYLIYIISLTYPLMVLYHIFITRAISTETDWITISRVVLGLFCVVMALLISRYFMRTITHDEKERQQLKSNLTYTQTGNHNFLANVSHELRTPINAINGISEIMLRQELAPEVRAQIESIHKANHRISRQVSSVLDYTEINMGELVQNEKEYNLRELVISCIEEIKPKAEDKHLTIYGEIDESLPETLYGEEQLLRKSISALLDNAIKYTSWGGVQLLVGKRDEDYGINLLIDIYDTGCGMTTDQIRNLYGEEYRANSKLRPTGGLGIGFYLAHYFVHAMNGFMNIESTPKEGTHVHLTIPQRVITTSKVQIDNDNISELFCNSHLRVLVVDDERLNLTVMKGLLKVFDIIPRVVESGSEALAMCQLEDYDLIFMDYMMPEMDGIEAMLRIRELRNGFYKDVPIVALTANAASSAKSMFLSQGFDEFMEKPVEINALNRLLKNLAGGDCHE